MPSASSASTGDNRRTERTLISWFDCSDPRVSRLHENVLWGMRGNFLHLPTDCPQRDERLGWTGDIQVFSPTASFLYDCDGFLSSWLVDLALEQKAAWPRPEVPLGGFFSVTGLIVVLLVSRAGVRRLLAPQSG